MTYDIQGVATLEKMSTMLRYQEQLNDVFDPQWRQNRHAYLRAASVESGEAIDHHTYKWWKKQSANLIQVQLEIVDILHFYLSEVARIANDPEKARADLFEAWKLDDQFLEFDGVVYRFEEMDTLRKLDIMMGLACARRINWALFRAVMLDAKLTFDSMYSTYAAKNVLNLFRQHNGDKQGTYIKLWSGREDNLYLEDLMQSWNPDEGMDVLYARLKDCYESFALGR